MKRIALVLTILCAGIFTYSQIVEDEITEQKKEEKHNDNEMRTLLGRSSSIGGYGGISILYSQIDSKDAFVFGARGAVVMGHVFAMGVGGAGFINDFTYDPLEDRNYSLTGGYGGMFFEPIFFPRFPIHFSIPVLIGVGGVAYTTMEPNDWDNNEYYVEDAETFLLIEPGLEMEMNITRYFRFSLGGYYRYTSGIDLIDTESDVLNGFSFGVNFKFGKF
jgi:hypothetical protein